MAKGERNVRYGVRNELRIKNYELKNYELRDQNVKNYELRWKLKTQYLTSKI